MRRIAVLDAPSNLGLRPPTETSVPGCAKAPGALRDYGLLSRLGARDAGCLTPPRYDPGDWRPGDGVCHASQIAAYSRKLADRIGAILDNGEFPVVLGGDCSIVLGSGLAMNRLGEAVGGRIGLVFVDGHSDFRHPGNASYVGAAAGEDLALVTGRGQADLAAMEGRRPYFHDIDVVVLGIRPHDEYRLDLQAAGIVTRPVPTLRVEGAARSAQWARDQLVDCAGFWVHVDMDVLDPAVMPAVDAPEPGGIAFPELELLLAGLVDTPHCLGVEITVFDPDFDPDGAYAEEITSTLVAGLSRVRATDIRPDLVEARRDLAASGAAEHPWRAPEPRPGAEPYWAARSAPVQPEWATRSEVAQSQVAQSQAARSQAVQRDGASEPDRVTQDDPVTARRAAAAGESVALAATGMSARGTAGSMTGTAGSVAGTAGAGAAQDVAVPATTLLGVEEGDELSASGAASGAEAGPAASEEDEPGEASREDRAAGAEDRSGDADRESEADASPDDDGGVRPASRPLGPAPLLDSDPLPATMPGMLRPRSAEGFSLPAQRPAFDSGPEEPADIT